MDPMGLGVCFHLMRKRERFFPCFKALEIQGKRERKEQGMVVMDELSLIPSKTEWDRIPTDPGPSKLRDRAMIDTQVFSGSVKRGSDRWRFLGLMESSVDFGMVILSAPVAVQSCNMPRWGGVAQLHEPQCDHHPLWGAMELTSRVFSRQPWQGKRRRKGKAWPPGTRFGRAVFSSNKASFYKMVKKMLGNCGLPSFPDYKTNTSGWWFETFFIFNPTWGRFPF